MTATQIIGLIIILMLLGAWLWFSGSEWESRYYDYWMAIVGIAALILALLINM